MADLIVSGQPASQPANQQSENVTAAPSMIDFSAIHYRLQLNPVEPDQNITQL